MALQPTAPKTQNSQHPGNNQANSKKPVLPKTVKQLFSDWENNISSIRSTPKKFSLGKPKKDLQWQPRTQSHEQSRPLSGRVKLDNQ